LPDIEYEIIWSFENGTEIDSMDFELDENGVIVSFGFYDVEVPYDPLPLTVSTTIIIAFIGIIALIIVIIVISWAYMKSSKEEVPEETRKRHKRKASVKTNKGYFDQS
ncbi:hypothetical protein LCGC14_1735680, partial [marine sediment metagenome]